MRVLALEPYYAGSHRAFLDGWRRHSRHDWVLLGLPGYKWKWRMRHAPITLAEQAAALDGRFDGVLCSDMLSLAEFRGLASDEIRILPAVAYFHENQLTYPNIADHERDYHFAMTNLTTTLSADAVWFNSDFHRSSFLDAMTAFLRRMPDYQSLEAIETIHRKSSVWPQGIEPMPLRSGGRSPGPTRILWAARWEHDKNFEDFYAAVAALKISGRAFRLNVLGEQFADVPPIFAQAKAMLADRLDRWGYVESREEYIRALLESDIVVSTANHEFFGVSVVEGIAAGAYPLLPRRLAYPEIVGETGEEHFYDGSVDDLTARLEVLISRCERTNSVWSGPSDALVQSMDHFTWPVLAPRLDNALDAVFARRR